MSKLILAVATLGLLAGTTIIWSDFVRVKPKLAITITQAEAEELMMLSPFEIMIKQGKSTPAEEWRYAF